MIGSQNEGNPFILGGSLPITDCIKELESKSLESGYEYCAQVAAHLKMVIQLYRGRQKRVGPRLGGGFYHLEWSPCVNMADLKNCKEAHLL